MIIVTKKGRKICIEGHALYADYGKDIVCSAVSSIVITTINGIIAINNQAITYQVKDANIQIEIQSLDNVTLTLVDNMMELLTKLSKDYPKNIQVKEGV